MWPFVSGSLLSLTLSVHPHAAGVHTALLLTAGRHPFHTSVREAHGAGSPCCFHFGKAYVHSATKNTCAPAVTWAYVSHSTGATRGAAVTLRIHRPTGRSTPPAASREALRSSTSLPTLLFSTLFLITSLAGGTATSYFSRASPGTEGGRASARSRPGMCLLQRTSYAQTLPTSEWLSFHYWVISVIICHRNKARHPLLSSKSFLLRALILRSMNSSAVRSVTGKRYRYFILSDGAFQLSRHHLPKRLLWHHDWSWHASPKSVGRERKDLLLDPWL